MSFQVVRATYSLSEDGVLSFSIECLGNAQLDFMGQPLLSFLRYPVGSALRVGSRFKIDDPQHQRISRNEPSTHLYAGDHFDPWNATVDVLAIEGQDIEVQISCTIKDPSYYDGRATNTAVRCRVWLSLGATSAMFDPIAQ